MIHGLILFTNKFPPFTRRGLWRGEARYKYLPNTLLYRPLKLTINLTGGKERGGRGGGGEAQVGQVKTHQISAGDNTDRSITQVTKLNSSRLEDNEGEGRSCSYRRPTVT